MKKSNKKSKVLSITLTIFSSFCFFMMISCEQDFIEDETIKTLDEISDVTSDLSLSARVEYINENTMNETNFNNGRLSPFYVRNTSGGNTVKVISKRAKFNWKQKNYNGRLTRNFKGAEIASPIEFTEQVYVGFKLYVPRTTGSITFPNNRNTTIAQILSAGGNCSSWSGMLEIKNNDLYISHRSACVTGTVKKILTGIPRGQWLDIQIRWVPSNNKHGGVQVKYNGNLIYTKRSVNLAWGTFSNENVLNGNGNNYMQVKYGMYCHDANNYTNNKYTNDSRTIYFDNVSVRQGSNGWGHTDPSN